MIRFFAVVSLVLGLVVLTGGGALWLGNCRFEAIAHGTDGVVVDLDRYESRSRDRTDIMYRAVVRFRTEDGREVDFTGRTASSQPGYSRGEKVRVLYDPAHPEEAEIDSFNERRMPVAMLTGSGAFLSLVGGGLLYVAIRERRKDKWLDQHGMCVEAKYVGVAVHSFPTMGEVAWNTYRMHRNPWRLKAVWQHPTTGTSWVFHSAAIWSDPSPFMADRETLSVKVNPDDPTQYRVDISFLPQRLRS